LSAVVFRGEPLAAIVGHVQGCLAGGAEVVELEVLDPDLGRGRHAGELVDVAGEAWRHRPLRVWVDLAGRLGLRLCTPRGVDGVRVALRFEKLREEEDAGEGSEKYGVGSRFSRIIKLEDADFLIDLREAIERVGLRADARVLELGVNRGDVLEFIAGCVPGLASGGTFVGVDHCRSALELARARFSGRSARFVEADLARLAELGLGEFDLVVAFATLQSSGLDDRALLRHVVQRCLAPDGALVIGLPNCRYRDGEVVHGARMRNFSQPELGLLIKDLAFYRKYMQQHGRTVYLTGKYEVLLTAMVRRGGLADAT
jgi:ubiquinone/menaquinone biosynthesis C-methylase UbiE